MAGINGGAGVRVQRGQTVSNAALVTVQLAYAVNPFNSYVVSTQTGASDTLSFAGVFLSDDGTSINFRNIGSPSGAQTVYWEVVSNG